MGHQDQIALVTGGARGIGAAIGRRVVADGGQVVVGDVDDEAGRRLAAELGAAAMYAHVDVTNEDEVAAALDLALECFGGLTSVFANAGAVGVTGPVESTSLESWRSTTDLLLTGVFLTLKHGVRALRPQGRGALVVTGSVASLQGGLGPHAYTAAKHGVLGLVRSVAVEVAPHGLRCNAVAPGGTVSSLSAGLMGADVDDLDLPYRRLAASSSSGVPTTAADVAAAACWLAGPESGRVNGTHLVVDGGDDVLASRARAAYFDDSVRG